MLLPLSVFGRVLCIGGLMAAVVSLSVAAARGEGDDAGVERHFRERIEPVLVAECYRCHSAQADELQGGLRLDSHAALLQGGDSGPAVDLQQPDASLLLQALRHQQGLQMPPDRPPLAPDVIADFAHWIARGARHANTADTAVVEPSLDAARHHWAFQPVTKPAVPHVQNLHWIRTPVDAFILSALEQSGWRPAEDAERRDLIRRVTFDLTGLPPTPDDIDAFVHDHSTTAYEQLIDRLLSSPQYGERWAQHWLDVVRYAESEGYEYDRHLPDAWRYRDYVIDSLNRDKPYDQFVREQLAGDELAPDNLEFQTAAILHRLGPVRRNAGNPELAFSRNEVLTERTNIIGEAFLGLTVGCARCHNHKLEPISQRDYYRLQAYVAATEEHDLVLASASEIAARTAQADGIQKQITRLKEQSSSATGATRSRILEDIAALEGQLPAPLPTIPGIRNDFEHFSAVHVLRRGVWEYKGEQVGPRPLSVLADDGAVELAPDAPHPRTELARWLTDPQHPLTARVIVNRLWRHHFGAGLVPTVNDFGTHGAPPSHPQLLDWLAATLIENGWRLKPLHRLIVLSHTYRQSSRSQQEIQYAAEDPDNRLLWRFQRRRLSAEEIRDAMLAVSGRLNLQAGGPSVITPVEPELVQLLYKPSQWTVTPDPREYDRRSIYLMAKRNLRLPFMEVFDAPALQTSCPERAMSTHAPQALELLNGALANDLAAAFAARLSNDVPLLERSAFSADSAPGTVSAGQAVPSTQSSATLPDRSSGTTSHTLRLIDRAYVLAIGRDPTPRERELSVAFLHDQPLSEFTLAIFNLNDFLYVR